MDCNNEIFNKVNNADVECPACKSKIHYRELIKSENIILKRYKAIIKYLKEEYGEVFLNDKTVLLGKIKELEHLYSIIIK